MKPGQLSYFRYENSAELVRNITQIFITALSLRQDVSVPFTVALSGGRISKLLFASLARELAGNKASLQGVHWFFADERCVPPAHAESNYASAQSLLFRPLNVPAEQVHRLHGEINPLTAAHNGESELCRIAPLNAAGQPILDILFLGMGEDGHVASLFPAESEEVRSLSPVYRPVVASKPPPQRITLGYPAIASAKQAWVLISGEGKENALKGAFMEGSNLPVRRVLEMRPHTDLFSEVGLTRASAR